MFYITVFVMIFVALIIALILKTIFEGGTDTLLEQFFAMSIVTAFIMAEVVWFVPFVVRNFPS